MLVFEPACPPPVCIVAVFDAAAVAMRRNGIEKAAPIDVTEFSNSSDKASTSFDN